MESRNPQPNSIPTIHKTRKNIKTGVRFPLVLAYICCSPTAPIVTVIPLNIQKIDFFFCTLHQLIYTHISQPADKQIMAQSSKGLRKEEKREHKKNQEQEEQEETIFTIARSKKLSLKERTEFKKNLKTFMYTTRFNSETWNTNVTFRQKKRYPCVYFTPTPLPDSVPDKAILIVLEMNNEINQLMGAGIVRNIPKYRKHNVYENQGYNANCFIGCHHIKRENIVQYSEELKQLWETLETFCFKGKTHLKRGRGLTAFPIATLHNCKDHLDIQSQIVQMFKDLIPPETTETTSKLKQNKK